MDAGTDFDILKMLELIVASSIYDMFKIQCDLQGLEVIITEHEFNYYKRKGFDTALI